MTIDVIADEIRRELITTDFSTPSIAFWLRGHIGDLNNLLGTSFEISSDSISVVPQLDEQEKSIFKRLFNIYYYDYKIRSFLGAASQDIILEVASDGATVRTVNKNELSKSYLQMKNAEKATLDELVRGYNIRSISPLQVVGEDMFYTNSQTNIDQFNRT